MRKIAMTAAGIAAAVIGTGVAMAPTASAATEAVTATACPSGAVCLREPDGSILSKNIWYSYGAHNLQNVTGYKVTVNSQTGGAGFKICTGYNGTGCGPVYRATGEYLPHDYTPINSIVLVR
ncbi:hypothetical protein EV651_10536 [Kribbella sp. VKM Ac-2571]|uniref:hypothetical protein n=1 Tax=Kribbella sp. VKM Ac-2571 TaxID=2512222 RepID=UPI001061FA0B|nr:hypothetical protein [Kribbella sp. VKM Ac-2571]TDO63814.1 hypothetical protein EV651_10536 [Kribbella sp. VKM Ac-2571]